MRMATRHPHRHRRHHQQHLLRQGRAVPVRAPRAARLRRARTAASRRCAAGSTRSPPRTAASAATTMIVEALQGWIDEDRKHTALKALQGMIWADGYRNADFTAPHLSRRRARAARAGTTPGMPLYVYSSGSVPAQKLFFGHSDAGDLTPLFSGWFDTEVGGKREADSYRRIAEAHRRAAGRHPVPVRRRRGTRRRARGRPAHGAGRPPRGLPASRAPARPRTATRASSRSPTIAVAARACVQGVASSSR